MKLARIGAVGEERPVIIDACGRALDLSGKTRDIDAAFLDSGNIQQLRASNLSDLREIEPPHRYRPPVATVRKLICTGPNYRKMSDESGAALPSEPRLYMKADTCVAGAYDDLILPHWAKTAHWEVELAVVIAREARDVRESAALEHIAGFCVVNDITDHNHETAGFGESVKGRSADGFGPLGPWLVTPDEVPDLNDLRLWLNLNGEPMQKGNSSRMHFKVPFLVSYISRFMTLRPGDVICTGTPGGVGLGSGAHRYLRPGDEIHAGIVGMGEQRTLVVESTCEE